MFLCADSMFCVLARYIELRIKCVKFHHYNFTEEHDATGTQYNMTIEAMEVSVDGALLRADFNRDGFIAWDEYILSLKAEMAQAQEHHGYGHQQEAANSIVVNK